MNFTGYFAKEILNGTKKIEIRKKPQPENQWIPIIVNGKNLGEMLLGVGSCHFIYSLKIEYWIKLKYFIELGLDNLIYIDKTHFDFYSNYFDGTPIYIYNIKEVRKFNEN